MIYLENHSFADRLGYTGHTFGPSPLGANDAAACPFTGAFDYTLAPVKPARMVHRALVASASGSG